MSIWEIFKILFDYTQSLLTKKPGPVIVYITLILLVNVADNLIPKDLAYISVFISIFWALISNAFLISLGHMIKENKELISFEKALKEKSTIEFFTERLKESVGMTLGNAVVFFIIAVGELLVLEFSGFLKALYQTKNHSIFEVNYTTPIALAVLFVIITLSMISYVAPYVYAKVYTTDSFKEAFSAVFDLISFGVWKRTMNLQYFFDISMWFVYSTMVIVMIIPLMFYAIVAPLGLIVIAIFIIQFPMFSVMIRYYRE